MGSRPNVELDSPHVVVNVHIARGQATVSIDTSGEPLFQRGYRVERGEAPLHETLAAAILFFANFDIAVHSHQTSETKTEDSSSVHSKKELNPTMNRIVLCDPFCGSGTFLAEAAMIMTNTPAGYKRNRWAFFHLPDFSLTEWETVKQQENKQILSLPENSLFGADQSIGNLFLKRSKQTELQENYERN
jgi:putative N6-adenine-specific DNA methylase